MKYLLPLLLSFSLAACGDDTDNTKESTDDAKSSQPSKPLSAPDMTSPADTPQTKSSKTASKTPPNFADYSGECPELWGMTAGASRAHVDRFVQNYIYVPDNDTAMYSDIQDFSLPNGSTLLKASTYNMIDTIVDQEMVVIFSNAVVTQCGVRFRCATDTSTWVSSCG